MTSDPAPPTVTCARTGGASAAPISTATATTQGGKTITLRQRRCIGMVLVPAAMTAAEDGARADAGARQFHQKPSQIPCRAAGNRAFFEPPACRAVFSRKNTAQRLAALESPANPPGGFDSKRIPARVRSAESGAIRPNGWSDLLPPKGTLAAPIPDPPTTGSSALLPEPSAAPMPITVHATGLRCARASTCRVPCRGEIRTRRVARVHGARTGFVAVHARHFVAAVADRCARDPQLFEPPVGCPQMLQ